MKRFIILSVLILSFIHVSKSQENIWFRVDFNTEFIGVVFSLTDSIPFPADSASMVYDRLLNEKFTRFSKLKIIDEFREEFGEATEDEQISFPFFFSVMDGVVDFSEYGLSTILTRGEAAAGITRFVDLTARIFSRIRFTPFYRDNAALYDDYCMAMKSLVLSRIDFKWFDRLYGPNPIIAYDFILNLSQKKPASGIWFVDSNGYKISRIVVGLEPGEDPFGDVFDRDKYIFNTVFQMVRNYNAMLTDFHRAEFQMIAERYEGIGRKFTNLEWMNAAELSAFIVQNGLALAYFDRHPNSYGDLLKSQLEAYFPEVYALSTEVASAVQSYIGNPLGYSSFDLFVPDIISIITSALDKIN